MGSLTIKQGLERLQITKLGGKGEALPSFSVSSPLVSSYRVNTELFWPLLETYGHRKCGLNKDLKSQGEGELTSSTYLTQEWYLFPNQAHCHLGRSGPNTTNPTGAIFIHVHTYTEPLKPQAFTCLSSDLSFCFPVQK